MLDFAVMSNRTSCNYFVDYGGLKLLFPILMQKALKDGSEDEQVAVRNQCISILMNLLLLCKAEFRDRLLPKFEENEHEKLKKLAEIFIRINEALAKVDRNKKAILAELDIDDPEEAQAELLSIKLDKGYLTLLSIAFILLISPVIWPEVIAHNQIAPIMKPILEVMKTDYGSLHTLAHELVNQTDDAKTRETILDFLQRIT